MRAHDLDVKSTPLAKHPNLNANVKAVGVSIANAGPLRTVDSIFADNGHNSYEIQYLKVGWAQ